MGRLIDADHVKDFFFSETSGTEDVIRDLMNTHGLDYANDIEIWRKRNPCLPRMG